MFLDKYKKFSLEYLIVFGICLITPLLIIRNGWIEPDSYAFYNYFCLNGKIFDIPILSNYFIGALSCEQFMWYGFQTAIWLLCFISIVDTNKIFNQIKDWEIGIIGISISFIYSVLAIEDDFLAFPLIAYGLWAWLKGNKIQQLFGLLCLIIALLFWKGALLIGLIIIFTKLHWLTGIGVVAYYIFSSNFDTWGGSVEAQIGLGIVSLIPFLFLLALSNKKDIALFRQTKEFYWSLPFLLLLLFHVKFGLYPILFLPVWLNGLIKDEDFRKKIVLVAGIIFIISLIGISLTKGPNQKHFTVVKEAVEIQESGEKVLTAWWAGRWFEYKGGVASQAGGYGGPQDANGSYWLGDEKKDCFTLSHEDNLFLQKC